MILAKAEMAQHDDLVYIVCKKCSVSAVFAHQKNSRLVHIMSHEITFKNHNCRSDGQEGRVENIFVYPRLTWMERKCERTETFK